MQLLNGLKLIDCNSEHKIWKTAYVIIKDGSPSLPVLALNLRFRLFLFDNISTVV